MRLTLLALVATAVRGVSQAGTSTSSSQVSPQESPATKSARALYQDPNLETAVRVQDLLSQMTLREKMAQLMQGELNSFVDFETEYINETSMRNHMFNHTGMLRVSYPRTTLELAHRGAKSVQDWIMNASRLSIPAIVQAEGLHGLGLPNATIFTSPIGLGASWDVELMEHVAETIGKEGRAVGITQYFAPSLDLARDPRHGRAKSFSEDPYLAGEFGAAFVRGLWKSKVASFTKHFAGYTNSEQGIYNGPIHGGPRELQTTFLPPFRRALQETGAFTVMSAYNSYDGIPSVSNNYLLSEWGFQYFTTSDDGGPDRLCHTFKMCRSDPIDKEAVTMMVLPAGGDTEYSGTFSFDTIPNLVSQGTLSVPIVDEAVRRVLRAKFDMGLFEDSFPAAPPTDWPSLIHTPEALDLATEMDRESIVLLHNRESILPLPQKPQRVAVLGPFADMMNYGDYTAYRPDGMTPKQGIQSLATKYGGEALYALGCEAWSNYESHIAEAVSQAQAADVAIVIVGTWARDLQGSDEGLNATTGEGYDTSDLRLVGAQCALIQQVIATGKPTVVVFSSGKPITEPWLSANGTAAALIQQFYSSQNGGLALADVLFGHHNPSGRLPISFPRDVGSLPVYYDYLNSGRQVRKPGARYANGTLDFGREYVLDTPDVWFGFGHGESYSTFEYSDVQVVPKILRASDNVTVTVNVKNTSDRDGKEVVQLYVVDPVSSVVTPNKQLKGFQKVFIRAGETATVSLEVRVSSLGLWDAGMRYVVEPGEFIAHVGRSSTDLRGNVSFFVV
ncbi:glycoside hydrolase [Aspergillus aculeatinus CBS 121060]|uniref:Glycoside hydrolase n=1 Tax=Aspergillus aculeatinus CBS 121060 TaxID=1448322 RepID=A0ACD1H1U4_9EURO|nr:glycoside hydrolase [Aspergillus aculeatinus CBS 121060]RAH67586.1 glycoside hydrolase [Aspergillus aculeatinus CBS 121060]